MGMAITSHRITSRANHSFNENGNEWLLRWRWRWRKRCAQRDNNSHRPLHDLDFPMRQHKIYACAQLTSLSLSVSLPSQRTPSAVQIKFHLHFIRFHTRCRRHRNIYLICSCVCMDFCFGFAWLCFALLCFVPGTKIKRHVRHPSQLLSRYRRHMVHHTLPKP